MAEIAVDKVNELRKSFGGEVSLPGSSSYDEAVRIWNGAITRRPAVVASCAAAGRCRRRARGGSQGGPRNIGPRRRSQLRR